MRIGVNCFLLQKEMGGLKQYFLRLFNELLVNDDENIYIFFYFKNNIEELKKLASDKWKKTAILLNDQHEIKNYLDRIDVYFCIFGALWPRPVMKPSVVTLVDIQEKYFPKFFTPIDLWNREMHYMASTKCADQVVTISEFSKNSLVSFHRIPKDKIQVAYLAADEFFYSPVTNDNKSSLLLPKQYVFYPANRWHHKNHDNLLKALTILREKYNIIVDCVLSGFDYPTGYSLKKNIEAYDLKRQVHDLGYVNTNDLKYIYQNASMLCFPSYFEGFGMPLLEAMACGCPVVCSNGTSIPEVVGDAAMFFDPHNAEDIAKCIFKLLSDDDCSDSLRRKGLKRAKLFSQKKTANAHIEAFKMAIVTYRKRRYFYYKYLYEPLHKAKMLYKWKVLKNVQN